MYNLVMFGSLGLALFLLLFSWSYTTQTPIVLMLEDNQYRPADCVYLPVPGVRCEVDY